ncbi:hypothetical protein JCM10213_002538 [Rhodosporidiobolus nylandii]
MDRQALSDALGLLSIATWLGAQSPQIYENWRNKSVEGLALPFLVSWFAGDFTNFLGCILTQQLPFQIYLSGYFLIVDVILCVQFAYYSRTTLPPLSETYPYAQPPSHPGTVLIPHRRSRSRKPRRSYSGRGKETPPYTPHTEDDPMQRSWMSETSVAPSSASSPALSHRPLPSRSSSQDVFTPFPSTASNTVPPSPTIPERGRTLTRARHVHPFDPSLSTIAGSPSAHGAFMHPSMHVSHVSFGSQPDSIIGEPQQQPDGLEALRRQNSRQAERTSSSRSRPPPPSRRSTSVVFLSVGALLTFGTSWGGSGVGTMDVRQGGRAWGTTPDSCLALVGIPRPRLQHPAFLSSPSAAVNVVLPPHEKRALAEPVSPSLSSKVPPDDDEPPPSPPPGPDWERIVGRASAWICTTAYLTSRLPQLWQNFRRRSCEGLAMTLFLFAFIGNSLYVASILVNPLASTSPGYLLESLPYLLGSGGTLCFDLAILSQAWLYSDKRKARRERDHRRRLAQGLEAEEAAALLDTDETDERDEDDDGEGTLRASRRRSRHTTPGSRSSSANTGGYASRSSSLRPAPARRSDSTEMGRQPSRSLSRAERGHLVDEPFDFDGVAGDEVGCAPNCSRSVSRGRAREFSAGSSIAEAIPEEGESTVTLRGG